MSSYTLDILRETGCSDKNLKIFSRAHMAYINQIFGDLTVREIIQEVWPKSGKLIVKESGEDFENSHHHMFQVHKARTNLIMCSVQDEYQNVDVDTNDTLCQSYSLMNYFGIQFNKKPSKKASVEIKRGRQMEMIKMYRKIISNQRFLDGLDEIIKNKLNKKIWEDTVDSANPFYIIEKLKTSENIVRNIGNLLIVWEAYGWVYFIGDGKCPK
jgi:hypothetical protein